MSDVFRRIMFEPRPGHGDVQWLDWDIEEGAFCGGSMGDMTHVQLIGFSDSHGETVEDLEQMEILCADCTLCDEEFLFQASGKYMVIAIGEEPMISPAKVSIVQTIEREEGE